jgi:hypothetical protein
MVLVASAYMCIIVVKSYWKIITTANILFRENDGKGETKSSPTALHSLPPAHRAQE